MSTIGYINGFEVTVEDCHDYDYLTPIIEENGMTNISCNKDIVDNLTDFFSKE